MVAQLPNMSGTLSGTQNFIIVLTKPAAVDSVHNKNTLFIEDLS
jgi:hypothetical protein